MVQKLNPWLSLKLMLFLVNSFNQSSRKKSLYYLISNKQITRLFVSERIPECSDCLLDLWSSFNMRKLNMKKCSFFFKFEIFCENHPPACHIKYNVIDFAPTNKPIMVKKTSLNQFGTIYKTYLISANALNSRNISRVNCPKLAKMSTFKPPSLTKKDHR